MEEAFQQYSVILEKEGNIKEEIKKTTKEMERIVRTMQAHLQQVHLNLKEAASVCQRVREQFPAIAIQFGELRKLVPPEAYYKFHDSWKWVVTQIVSIAAFVTYIESQKLIGIEQVEQLIQVPGRGASGAFCVELEDYLLGLCSLPNELARVCVNSVIIGDFQTPLKISHFVSEISAGFRLLNLKNDNLRKKYDSIKYDVKKIEEVVYDISIRKLNQQTETMTQ
eukprot:TRINITY_DN1816_c0_g1_i1.p1 TRINITY_DN1816_c0_g1~~TRINITY_DN1816_c0_g1_i1.p1  ORF type:complete len:224 (+),score=44.16 TRINITY_DN1816_c0_g1_i1:348-1019(+)